MKRLLSVLLVLIINLSIRTDALAQSQSEQPVYQEMYAGFIVKNLKKTKDFYTSIFMMNIIFESSWFILFQSNTPNKTPIAFMHKDHPSSPPANQSFNTGAWLTLQVEDAKLLYEKLKADGVSIKYALKDEDWGQRRFGIIDPNGIYIDIVQQIQPKTDYWNKYPVSKMQ